MKLTVSLLVLLVITCMCTSAFGSVVLQQDTLYAGWNNIAMQGVPLDPSPRNMFPAGLRLDGYLWRWDGATQSQYTYDDWAPGIFGNMLLGDGYWIYSDTDLPYSYNALNDTDTMDMWISLPKTGWHMFGNPFGYNYNWELAKVTDGNSTVSIKKAKENGWMQSSAFWWNGQEQSQYDVGPADDWPSGGTVLLPKHAYFIETYVDKIALILEAQQ